MSDDEFIERNARPTHWWDDLVHWMARHRPVPIPLLANLSDDDLP